MVKKNAIRVMLVVVLVGGSVAAVAAFRTATVRPTITERAPDPVTAVGPTEPFSLLHEGCINYTLQAKLSSNTPADLLPIPTLSWVDVLRVGSEEISADPILVLRNIRLIGMDAAAPSDWKEHPGEFTMNLEVTKAEAKLLSRLTATKGRFRLRVIATDEIEKIPEESRYLPQNRHVVPSSRQVKQMKE